MASTTLASTPGNCCARGFKRTGKPEGKISTIAGVETYIAKPSREEEGHDKKIILFFSDIFSSVYANNQLLMDYFAQHGFIALGLDYFFGDPIQNHNDEEGFNFKAWVSKSIKQADDCVPKWVEAVKAEYGTDSTKYFAVGYCFGAQYTLRLGATDFLEATAFAHPSLLEESHFEKIKAPLLLSCAEVDEYFPTTSRRRAEDILMQQKSTYYMQIFSGVEHGFASHGDPDDPKIGWAIRASAAGVVEWFNRFSA